MISFLQKLGRWPVLLLHDNDPKHTSKTTTALLKSDGLAKHVSRIEPNWKSLGDPQAEGRGAQSIKYPPAPRHQHGGVEEHSSGYLRSSGKLHAQESKGSAGYWWWPHRILTVDMVYVNIDSFPKGALTFVGRGLAFNGSILSYFEGKIN